MIRRFAIALLLATATRANAATDPASPGPYAAGVRTQTIAVTGGDSLTTDVHFPDAGGVVDPAAGACPLLVFGHGFGLNKDVYTGHGAHWASRGYITLIPNLVGVSDHGKNADDLVALVTWALAENLDPASYLYGRIDGSAIGATGHSAGGLSSLVATSRDARIRATAPFDPVDNAGLGAAAMPTITVPVAITYSEDSSCNANGSARVLYAAGVPVKRGVKIVNANHCDPLDPASAACSLFCGATDPARQLVYRRYVTGWFEFWLRCDPTYYEWVYGSKVQDDVTMGRVTYDADPDPGPIDPCVGVAPPEVQGLRAFRSGGDVALRWDPVTASPAVIEYRAYRSLSMPFVFGPPFDVVASPSALDPMAIGTSPELFFYQVRAVNSVGEGR